MAQYTTNLNIRVKPGQIRGLKRQAKAEGRTVAGLIRRALDEYLERHAA